MTQRPHEPGIDPAGGAPDILNRIHEDMDVFDSRGERVGEVEWVYLGASSPEANRLGHGAATTDRLGVRDTDSLLDIVARAFGEDDLPDVLRNRLLHAGFVYVDGDGLFAADRYVLPDQISRVTGDAVHLSVTRDELIKD